MASSVAIFKSKLKTYLFDNAFNSGWSALYPCPKFLLHVMMFFFSFLLVLPVLLATLVNSGCNK